MWKLEDKNFTKDHIFEMFHFPEFYITFTMAEWNMWRFDVK